MSVSYTHLDVYKRQSLLLIVCGKHAKNKRFVVFKIQADSAEGHCIADVVEVPCFALYNATDQNDCIHIFHFCKDVYKRQLLILVSSSAISSIKPKLSITHGPAIKKGLLQIFK